MVLTSSRAAHFDGRFDALGIDHLPPGFEPFLECDDPSLGQGYLDGLEDLLFGETKIQGHTYVTLDVCPARPHCCQAGDKDELLRLAVESTFPEIGRIDEAVGCLQDVEIMAGHHL